MYIPDDEGSYSSWITKSTPRDIVFQFFAHAGTSSPELHGLLGKDLKLDVELSHSVSATTESSTKYNYSKNLLPNRWNQIVIWYKRDWDTPGEFKMWINPDDWSTAYSYPDFTKTKGVGIRVSQEASFRIGQYRSDVNSGVTQVVYYDNLRIFPSTEAWADVVSGFSGETTTTPPPSTQTPAILTINGGSAVSDSATEVPFTTENLGGAVVGGYLGSDPNDSVYTAWDFDAGNSGWFDAGDLSGFTSSPINLTLFYEPIANVATLNASNWIDNSQIVLTNFSGDDWGYTSGLTITADGTPGTRVYSHRNMGYTTPVSVGQRLKATMIYKLSAGADEVGLGIEDGSGNWISFWGTPGSLTEDTAAPGSRFGTNRSVAERDLGNGIKRMTVFWTAATGDNFNSWTWRPFLKSPTVGQKLTIYGLYLQHEWNAASGTVTKSFPIGITDSTAPTISNAALTLSYSANIDDDGDNTNNYTASYSFDVSELAECYMYRSSSATPPSTANLKAGTGAGWHQIEPSGETSISAEIIGVTYSQYYMHTLCTDSASNDSSISTVSNTYAPKQLVFSGNLKRGGTGYSGTADHFKIFDEDPLLNRNAVELLHAEGITITSGSVTIDDSDLTSGSIDLLSPSTDYWFYLFDEDKDPFAFGEMQTTAE